MWRRRTCQPNSVSLVYLLSPNATMRLCFYPTNNSVLKMKYLALQSSQDSNARPPILAGRRSRNDESQFSDNIVALKISDVWSGNDSTMFWFPFISTVVLGVPVTWISLGPVHLRSWSVSLVLVLLSVHFASHSSLLGVAGRMRWILIMLPAMMGFTAAVKCLNRRQLWA